MNTFRWMIVLPRVEGHDLGFKALQIIVEDDDLMRGASMPFLKEPGSGMAMFFLMMKNI